MLKSYVFFYLPSVKRAKQIRSKIKALQIENEAIIFENSKYDFLRDGLELALRIKEKLDANFFAENDALKIDLGSCIVSVDSKDELYIINEIFCDQCYDFDLDSDDIRVIDIGMNVGLASLFFASRPSVKEVIGYEPVLSTFEKAQDNFALNPEHAVKIESYNTGLSDKNGDADIILFGKSRGKSKNMIYHHEKDDLKIIEKIILGDSYEVMENIISDRLSADYLLKIDCEGDEVPIINSLFKNGTCFKEIKAFLIEWHWQEPDQIINTLQNGGFSTEKTYSGENFGMIHAYRIK